THGRRSKVVAFRRVPAGGPVLHSVPDGGAPKREIYGRHIFRPSFPYTAASILCLSGPEAAPVPDSPIPPTRRRRRAGQDGFANAPLRSAPRRHARRRARALAPPSRRR